MTNEARRFSSQELDEMFNFNTPYTLLQLSFMITQNCCKSTIFRGKFPLMLNVEDEINYGWIVDPETPPEFWFARRQEIRNGTTGDYIFVPLIPDSGNVIRHPIAVAKAIRLQGETKKMYGDRFRFVFTRDPDERKEERYIIKPYIF